MFCSPAKEIAGETTPRQPVGVHARFLYTATADPRDQDACALEWAGLSVEVALLSELEFKHQVTTARGEGGRRGRRA